MADYTNFIKVGELLIDPTVNCKPSYVLKCSECGKYIEQIDKFISHCLGHWHSKSPVDAGSPTNLNYVRNEVVQMQYGNNIEIEDQEFFAIIKEEQQLNENYRDEVTLDEKSCNITNYSGANAQINIMDKENYACENCKRLGKKVDGLQESFNALNRTIMSALSEIKVVTTNFVRQEGTITAATTEFPITSQEMLHAIENNISPDNHASYVSTISKQWRNSLNKNLESVLHSSILMAYNLDGTHGKYRLKDFKKLYSVLLDSIMCLPSESNKDPEQVLRHAMQLNKKKQFRQLSAKRASEVEEMDS